MSENTPTPKYRFLDAVTEALHTFNHYADEFGFDIGDDGRVTIEFYNDEGKIVTALTAYLLTLDVTEEN